MLPRKENKNDDRMKVEEIKKIFEGNLEGVKGETATEWVSNVNNEEIIEEERWEWEKLIKWVERMTKTLNVNLDVKIEKNAEWKRSRTLKVKEKG